MKHFQRHIAIWLFLFYGVGSYASHVIGGEITYKHIKENKYKITLLVYRDCNGCKINGQGGGGSSEDCSEIEYLFVRGTDNSTSKETKFALTRESIQDITPICAKEISACNKNATSIFGIEIQKFTANIDLDNSKIVGYCTYNVYVSFAERNANITTGQASQNFCIDALINICHNGSNNSPDFISTPEFIINSNKTQYKSYLCQNSDKDSLAYKLVPAWIGFEKEANYGSGFSSSSPLTIYCSGIPCTPDKSKDPPIGFYLDPLTGETVFVPISDGERAVIVVMVEKYRKISGSWVLLGYIKRDLQVFVKAGEGNFSPKILGNTVVSVCEGELIELNIESIDEKNSITNKQDTVFYTHYTDIPGGKFSEAAQSMAPYHYGNFKWTPKQGDAKSVPYYLMVNVRDNNCPLNATSTKTFEITVLPKNEIKLTYASLGCGNYEINSSSIPNNAILNIHLISLDRKDTLFKSRLIKDSISFVPPGTYLLEGVLTNDAGCTSVFIDTIKHSSVPGSIILGDSVVCEGQSYDFNAQSSLSPTSKISWYSDTTFLGTGAFMNVSFTKNSTLSALVELTSGKWYCLSKVSKPIQITLPPTIVAPSEIMACYNSGTFDLSQVSITPNNGIWNSSSDKFTKGMINTSSNYPFLNDTTEVTYEVSNLCKSTATIKFIFAALPEFLLSDISICEMKSFVQLMHLVKKPYKLTDYTYEWGLEFNSHFIKDDNNRKVIYPLDLGYGKHTYFAKITSKNGCVNFDTATIEITPAVKINVGNPVAFCQESGSLDVTNALGITPQQGSWSFYDFQLFQGNNILLTDTCGEFEATYIYDQYGCYDAVKIRISILCKPQISLVLPKKLCETELPLTLKAIPTGGTWIGPYINGNTFLPPPQTSNTDYKLQYFINQLHCRFMQQHTLRVIPSPKIQIFPNKLLFCEDEDLLFSGIVLNTDSMEVRYNSNFIGHRMSGTKNFNNTFFFRTEFIKKQNPQSIAINAMNIDGCTSNERYDISVFGKPILSGLKDTFVCFGEDALLKPNVFTMDNSNISYKWFKDNLFFSSVKDLGTNTFQVGIYDLRFETGNDFCSAYKNIKLEIKPTPFVKFNVLPAELTSIVEPEFHFINQSEPNLQWRWDFDTNLGPRYSTAKDPIYTYKDTGTYNVTLTGTNEFGCSSQAKRTLVVKPDILIFIPNAFSPDGKNEEKNNVFGVSLDNYQTYSIEIFDRWGQKVYMSNDPAETWDGTSKDVKCTPDVYFYFIKVSSFTRKDYSYRGTITLIR